MSLVESTPSEITLEDDADHDTSVTITSAGYAGGFGAVIAFSDPIHPERTLWGRSSSPTSACAALTAVVVGLRALKDPSRVDVYTDSEYVARKAVDVSNRVSPRPSPDSKFKTLWSELIAVARDHDVVWYLARGGKDVEKAEELARLFAPPGRNADLNDLRIREMRRRTRKTLQSGTESVLIGRTGALRTTTLRKAA